MWAEDESVLFRGQPVKCVVVKGSGDAWADGEVNKKTSDMLRRPELVPLGFALVRALKEDISPYPKVGESFTMPDGEVLRIQEVSPFKISTVCFCKIGNQATANSE